jgi:hypothetical protein
MEFFLEFHKEKWILSLDTYLNALDAQINPVAVTRKSAADYSFLRAARLRVATVAEGGERHGLSAYFAPVDTQT